MTKYTICCEECFKDICERSPTCARLWMDLCATRIKKGGIFRVLNGECPEVRKLELSGFLTSTDKEFYVLIDVHGLMTADDGSDFFCIKDGNHGN